MNKDDSAGPNVNIEDIVSIDYVWGKKTLVEAAGLEVYFDYLVASHVVKHVPDMIGWFGEIPAVLKAGDVLSLVVPDKRFMFDCQRDVSGASEFIDALVLKSQRPPLRLRPSEYQAFLNREFSTCQPRHRAHSPEGCF